MSVDSFIFLNENRLPTLSEWQRALDDEQCGIVLESIDDLHTHSGYLPADYRGHPSGFEWFFGPVADVFGEKPEAAGDRSHAIDLVTHSDMQELLCGMVAGAVLAKLANGLVLDEESGECIDDDKALEIAKQHEKTHH
jgi:hypothetical protein